MLTDMPVDGLSAVIVMCVWIVVFGAWMTIGIISDNLFERVFHRSIIDPANPFVWIWLISLAITTFLSLIVSDKIYYFIIGAPSIADISIATKTYAAAGCALVGAAAYMIRCRMRLMYGLFETAIGITSAYLSASSLSDVATIQFLGGVYIVVRGLDNIEKGLKNRPDAHNFWKTMFGPQL